MKNPLFQLKRYLVLLFLALNQICLAQTQITDFKYENTSPDNYSLIGKVNNTVFFTQTSQNSITSIWTNTIGDSTTKFIGKLPDRNFSSLTSHILNNRVYFFFSRHAFNSELWTCDSTEGSLRQVYKFDEVGSILILNDQMFFKGKGLSKLSVDIANNKYELNAIHNEVENIFIFNNQMIVKGKGLTKFTIDETNNKFEFNTLIEDLTNISLTVLEDFIIGINAHYLEKNITIINKNFQKQTVKFPDEKVTNITNIRELDNILILDAETPNVANILITEMYTYDISRKEFKYLTQKTRNLRYETFYFSKDTLNQLELFGTEKNYTLLRSELINGNKVEKLNISLKKSLGFSYWGLIFYSNFKIIDDDLHFLSYTFDSTNKYVTKEKYLERLSLKTGNLESNLVNEISQSPYPLWDYGYNDFLFELKQQGEILKISPGNPRFAPILGFDLKHKKIIKFDTLSQPNSLSISIGNNKFLWLENSNLNFLDTLKRSIRSVKTIKEVGYTSAIVSSQIVDEDLFLIVRSSENEFYIQHFDGEKLQKNVIIDSVQYFQDFRVSNKFSDGSYLLYFNYQGIVNNRLIIYHFNPFTKQIQFISTFVNSEFSSNNPKEVFYSAGKYFFKKGYYQNVITDLTNECTKILPQLNKQDSQEILHVSAKGNVLVRERETLSLIKPPYKNSTILGQFNYPFTYVSYNDKLFFFSNRKLYVYENEKIRVISENAYIVYVNIQRVSDDEVVFWDYLNSINKVNLKTEKVTLIYKIDESVLHFQKKVNNDYLFTIYNRSLGKYQLLVYDGNTLKTKVVLTYNSNLEIKFIGEFTDRLVWTLVKSNYVIDYGIYKDGVAKRMEGNEISVFDKNQLLEIIYDPISKEFKIFDLSFGIGVTKVPVKDNILWVTNKQKFGKYYAFEVLSEFSESKDNFSPSLWVTDGTIVNTIKIADRLAYGLKYVAIGSKLYFTANNDQTGNELWETDGTINGTHQIADIWEGTFSSSPDNLMKIGKYLYCFATTAESGRQLWRIKEVEKESDMNLDNEELIENSAISVYPNPTTNFLIVKSKSLDLKDAKIELFDLIGKKVQEMGLGNVNTIDLSTLPNGVYTLRIIVNGKKYISKIVKY